MHHPLVQEFVQLLSHTQDLNRTFDDWRQRCATQLQAMPNQERRAVIEKLREVLVENRALLEQESQLILDELVDPKRNHPADAAKAIQYKNIKELKN